MANFLNTRIRLKYDLYDNWSTKNPILLEGEVAIAVPGTTVGSVETAATCLMKVGNGTSHFNDLPWLSAVAADVHAWAKKSEAEFKTWLTSTAGPALATNADLTALGTRVTNIETDLNTATTGLKARMTAAEGEIDALQAELDTAETGLKARVTAAEGEIDALQEAIGTGTNGLATRVGALETRAGQIESKNTEQDTAIENITKADTGAIAVAVKAEAERAQGIEGGLRTDVNTILGDYLKAADKTALEGKIATETSERTSAISAAKTELEGKISAKADATALNNYYTKAEADAEFMTQTEVDNRINALIVGADPEGGKTIENIQNLVKYVDENAGSISGLVTTVGQHTQDISGINTSITNLGIKDGEID